MAKTRILFMINSMGLGGAEKSLLSLLQLLDYDKYDVDLQMLNFGGMFEGLLPKEVHILPDLNYSKFCKQPLFRQLLSFNIKLLSARMKTTLSLRKNNKTGHQLHDTQAYWRGCKNAYSPHPNHYDVAIAWGQGTPTHYVATKVTAKKKFAWINANYELAGHNRNFDRPYYAAYDGNVCVSNELAVLFRQVFPEYESKLHVVLDIKNPALILKMAEEPIALPRKAATTIVTAGRYTPPKNYLLAIDTAAELWRRGITDFVWYAVGEGDQRSHMEAKIADLHLENQFILLGAKSNPYPYMKAADIYVQTSSFEGYCLTLAEARMLNRPCVTTNFDVVYEQMVQGENGLVVDMSPEAVADGIQRLLEDKALYEHIRQYQMSEKKGNTEEIEKFYQLIEG